MSGCKGRDVDLLAEAAAQTTTNPAAKVTPHLSPARRPAGPRHLMTKCQNSLVTLRDAHIHVVVPFLYLTLHSPNQTDSSGEVSMVTCITWQT